MNERQGLIALKKNLLGSAFSSMSVSDYWSLAFDNGLWVVAQNVLFLEEKELNDLLKSAKPHLFDGVDPENIVKGILLLRNMRQTLTDILLESTGELRLIFANRFIIIPVYEAIVDWQWCLNKTGKDPYSDFIVACFNVNEIKVNL